MAFTGESGALTLSEILGLCVLKKGSGTLEITDEKYQHLITYSDGKIIGITSTQPPPTVLEILSLKNLITSDQAESIQGNPDFETNPENVLEQSDIANREQLQQVRYHQAETMLFRVLVMEKGTFRFTSDIPEDLIQFDLAFRDWISGTIPDITKLTEYHQLIEDFDSRLFWTTPAAYQDVTESLSIEEIKILAGYSPGISVRNYLYKLDLPHTVTMDTIIGLINKNVLSSKSPDVKPPDSRPFLRAVLDAVVSKLIAAQNLIGQNGEVIAILKQFMTGSWQEIPTSLTAPAGTGTDDLDDLSSITSSIEDLLTMDDLESLDIQPDEQEKAKPEAEKVTASAGQDSSLTDTAEWLKSDLQEPEKPEKKEKLLETGPLDELISIEDQVEAKVSYRRFISNVTMASNRLKLRKMNYFEMLGVPPNADKRAIHKAFVRAIRKINPKGVRLSEREKKYLDMAVRVRDQLKTAYDNLTDPQLRRKYLLELRQTRESEEEKKSKGLVLFNRGMVEFKSGRFQKAKELFLQAAKLDPNSPVYYNMLETIDKEERSTNAMKYYQAGMLAFSKKNDADRAIKLIRKAMTMSPGQVIFYVKLAEIQAANPSTRSDANHTFQEALELDPSNTDLRLQYAGFLNSNNMKQEAANTYQDVLKWDPENMAARKKLGALRKEGIQPKRTTEKGEIVTETDDIEL
ncbi:tetratricopeptide repeat protein [bacterium]|nr:tetratricopeptide repeat protein [candidate division CSSED10-310 bacterium]